MKQNRPVVNCSCWRDRVDFPTGKSYTVQEKRKAEVSSMEEQVRQCGRPEFVGTAVLDTIGLVVAGADQALLEKAGIDHPYKSIGILSARSGASCQLTAIDDAVKTTSARVLSVMLPRDSKGWGGHGCYIVLGADNVADVRYAVQMGLELTNKYAGEVYLNEAGHMEFAFSPSAGPALHAAFGTPEGRAFGLLCGSPAGVGFVMADQAVKAAAVDIVGYYDVDSGISHTNEVYITISGDASDVRRAVLKAREVGTELLSAMGGPPHSVTTPYLKDEG